MAFIRVGFFEDFKSANSLLIDVDGEGLRALIAWLQTAAASGQRIALDDCPGAVVQSGLYVAVSCAPTHRGLVRIEGTEFAWERSEQGWADVIDKLAAMESGACHQYLEGPTDNVQVVA